MRLKRLFARGVLGGGVSLLASASYGHVLQCAGSVLNGNWELVENDLACPIKILNGTLTTAGSCAAMYSLNSLPTSPVTAAKLPSGNLLIDAACHATGSFTFQFFATCYGNPPTTVVVTVTKSTEYWLSLDGSRLSGYATGLLSDTCNGKSYSISTFMPSELIYVPRPPPPP